MGSLTTAMSSCPSHANGAEPLAFLITRTLSLAPGQASPPPQQQAPRKSGGGVVRRPSLWRPPLPAAPPAPTGALPALLCPPELLGSHLPPCLALQQPHGLRLPLLGSVCVAGGHWAAKIWGSIWSCPWGLTGCLTPHPVGSDERSSPFRCLERPAPQWGDFCQSDRGVCRGTPSEAADPDAHRNRILLW